MDRATLLEKGRPGGRVRQYDLGGGDMVSVRGLSLKEQAEREKLFPGTKDTEVEGVTPVVVWVLERCLLDDTGDRILANGQAEEDIKSLAFDVVSDLFRGALGGPLDDAIQETAKNSARSPSVESSTP